MKASDHEEDSDSSEPCNNNRQSRISSVGPLRDYNKRDSECHNSSRQTYYHNESRPPLESAHAFAHQSSMSVDIHQSRPDISTKGMMGFECCVLCGAVEAWSINLSDDAALTWIISRNLRRWQFNDCIKAFVKYHRCVANFIVYHICNFILLFAMSKFLNTTPRILSLWRAVPLHSSSNGLLVTIRPKLS